MEPQMEFIQLVIDFILHIDRHLAELTASYSGSSSARPAWW
jgi:membrane-associated protein